MSTELLSRPKRATPPAAAAWKSYMPQRGNGGVPTEREVLRYLRDTRRNRELRQKVLGELREVASEGPELLVNIVTSGLAVLTVLATIAVAVTAPMLSGQSGSAGDVALSYLGWIALFVVFVFIVGIQLAIFQKARARHAASWLAAYDEAESRARKRFGVF